MNRGSRLVGRALGDKGQGMDTGNGDNHLGREAVIVGLQVDGMRFNRSPRDVSLCIREHHS